MRPAAPSVASIAERLGVLRERLDALGGSDVVVVAVTKAFPGEVVTAAADAGCRAIGENYAQELLFKRQALGELGDHAPEVHFIGHLQSNKVRSLVGTVDVWQTLDRASVVDEVGRRVPGAVVMIQVNTTGERSKSGCAPSDAERLVATAAGHGLDVAGLMTVGPTSGDRAHTRRAFRTLRRLADGLGLASCSMGMTGDYEIAVEQGSTHVRIGTMLFGQRRRAR